MARWPSGKAEACKAFIPGSNPGLASSKLTTPASAGASFLLRVHFCLNSSQTSLKSTSCLSKFTQTWREKPANSSDMVCFSGKSFRHGEKIRLHESVHKTNLEIRVTSRKVCLKSAKNLYLSHRFFDKIRHIHRFFDVFRQKLQILCRNQARSN